MPASEPECDLCTVGKVYQTCRRFEVLESSKYFQIAKRPPIFLIVSAKPSFTNQCHINFNECWKAFVLRILIVFWHAPISRCLYFIFFIWDTPKYIGAIRKLTRPFQEIAQRFDRFRFCSRHLIQSSQYGFA